MKSFWIAVAAALVISPAIAGFPALAMDRKLVQPGAPDLTKARALIKKKQWQDAIVELKQLEAKGPNADVYNLLGFSMRKSGKFDTSYDYYMKALKLEPNHLSAHEYLGELYIQTNRLEKAKEQAAILAKLCPDGCEEREDLDEALAKATAR